MSARPQSSEPDVSVSIDFLREYHTSLITASGFLITVPLLALSILASSNLLLRWEILGVAIPTVASAVVFAISIHYMGESMYQGGRAFAATDPANQSARVQKASAAITKGRKFFEAGLAILIISMIVMVIALL